MVHRFIAFWRVDWGLLCFALESTHATLISWELSLFFTVLGVNAYVGLRVKVGVLKFSRCLPWVALGIIKVILLNRNSVGMI